MYLHQYTKQSTLAELTFKYTLFLNDFWALVHARVQHLVIHPFQDAVNASKAGSVTWVGAPAQTHQVIELQWTLFWALQHMAIPDIVYHLFMCHAVVRLHTMWKDFPKHHSIGPDIWLCGVTVIEDRLRWHPADRNGIILTGLVVVGCIDVPWQAKVRNLHHQVLTYEAVPCGQVPVHKFSLRQVRHACCHLLGYRKLIQAAEWTGLRLTGLGTGPHQTSLAQSALLDWRTSPQVLI